MPTTSVDDYHCNTVFSGWLNGAEPTVGDGEVFRTVCFTRGADTCKHSITTVMKNCGSYFIYKLVPPPVVIIATMAQTRQEAGKWEKICR